MAIKQLLLDMEIVSILVSKSHKRTKGASIRVEMCHGMIKQMFCLISVDNHHLNHKLVLKISGKHKYNKEWISS